MISHRVVKVDLECPTIKIIVNLILELRLKFREGASFPYSTA